MVTTRRQGATSKTAIPDGNKGNNANSASDGNNCGDGELAENDSSQDIEDEDNNLNAARKSRRTAPKSPAKHQKVAAESSTAGAVKPARRHGKDLSLFPTMPLDILFEILGRLSPKDLLSLLRTNKLFHQTLMSPNATTVWKAARESYDAPEPMTNFSEVRWVSLLFNNFCHTCGTDRVSPIDWGLQRRICKSCKESHVVHGSRYKSRFLDYNVEALDYVLYTTVGAHSTSAAKSKYYYDSDLCAISKEYDRLAALGTSGTDNVFEAWKKDRKDLIESVIKMVPVCERWMEDIGRQKAEDIRVQKQKRLEAIKARFLELGYSKIDIDPSFNHYSEGIKTGTANITDAVWSRLRIKLEPAVLKTRNIRIASEMDSTIKERMAIFKDMYEEYRTKLRPSDAYCCPPFQAFRPFPELIQLIEGDPMVKITNQDFQPIIDNMADLITRHQTTVRTRLLAQLPRSDTANQVSDPLGLAKNIFLCRMPYDYRHLDTPFVGWAQMTSHLCINLESFELRPGVYIDMPRNFQYSARLSKVSSTLISLLELDPDTATIADVDEKDGRFSCTCKSNHGKYTYTWRGMLEHGCGNLESSSRFCEFYLATPEETTAARHDREYQTLLQAWSCNHCFTEMYQKDTKPKIFEHLAVDHAITEPKLSDDYFLNEKYRSIFEAPYCIPKAEEAPFAEQVSA